ncbi:Ankyrin repeats domain-containing protein [Phytophthora infestans]|uniref:Ankyrin repeats domain-containing protein n=1 Tax=Phytophthora infestans TaxID=4787 RepID=A0A8S9UUG0_PHYIN|nr:Ankyrin repeats domain-containing protein [Phytophthora infestans]
MGAKVSACIWQYADIQYGFLDQELGFDNLHALAAQGKHKAVRKLLRHGMDPNSRRLEGALGADDDERGDSPMICAARLRHLKTLEELLHFGAKINQTNLLNQTPLYIACERNLLRVATWLIQHGADVNINCKTGVSPLMCAYQNQNETLATLLLYKGAVVIRLPATFSHIKFHELSDELDDEDASSNDKTVGKLHATLQQFVDREAARRECLLKEAHEAQRLEEQRIYRAQLSNEGAKRKARRRRKRLEAQQKRNLPPVKALDTVSDTERDEGHLPSGCGDSSANQGEEGLLLWEKKAMNPRASSRRPQWVARQIHCTQQSQNHRTESEHDFMRQCSKLYKSIQQERSRRISPPSRSVVIVSTKPT